MSFAQIVIAGSSVSPLPEWLGISFGVVFPFFFVGMWLFVSFMLASHGWVRFATAYRCDTRPVGSSFSVPYASFGALGPRYNGVVRAVVTQSGLYLYNFILFRAFHHPFILPWSSIERVERYSFLWSGGYDLHIRDGVGSFQMRIRDSLATELRVFVPHLFPDRS